ncbi:CEI_1a_G0036090.mRNA.1.CDS.1 [Saccharomyces cerevisiae]|nr:EM14S01-3B_G0037920.mRNA.1.CDS.1 [Saccharomyces cerevisiae]CAI4680036.1 AMH_1a_G0036240.mRNA.1.CDS.1 [Saccharomyces cerevisiae]CAI4684837.1 CEI_1a_G0036090.mRNA.1.CDS.1 [Saccharomyces cerevisiae]CAI6834046.1 AMH_1a_G0036240.mRNA.1.CDS.1 [Saccharomyces cerevisiae]CAI7424104.1 CEI_1a_G0036090.mRNA.1.CDS.1 [Saccharomyces cerevisiae]
MASNAARVVATAKDFDKVGLGIIGYYLQLYAVELILSEEDRSQEMTALATELLDTIEAFKKEIGGESEAEDSDKSLHVMNTLIHDQEKAKIYMLNFTMSLYNEKLKQLKDGPWDVMLKRSLWCCIDLFSCILHLWKENISETSTNSLQKRIKYCKIYLSKFAKGEIGSSDEKTLDYADFADDSEETKDEDVDHLTSDLENNNNDKVEGLAPKDQTTSYEPVDEVPEFIDDADSVNEEEQTVDKNEDAITKDEQQVVKKEVDLTRSSAPSEPAAAEHKSYTKDELTKMMDRASKIEQIQKLAKYAISALNYEDLPTAKDELTKALDLLNSI